MSDNGAMLIRHGLAIMALLAAGWWLVSLDSAFLAPLPQPSHEGASIPAKDRAAYERLMAAMETDKVYLDPELTVSRLAAKIGLPDHQLRSLINQTLGHRNFSSFINGYRLSYAKTLLADPQSARIPILTIAYDSGFQTLSTFNRAFRADRGEAPSDYRRRKLADVVTAETCNLKASSQHAPV
jgi:AraC-like DNA-binding protein